MGDEHQARSRTSQTPLPRRATIKALSSLPGRPRPYGQPGHYGQEVGLPYGVAVVDGAGPEVAEEGEDEAPGEGEDEAVANWGA